MSSAVNFSKVTFALVTGASQGIGQTIAVELAKRIPKGSLITLLARNEANLNKTKSLVAAVNPDIIIQVHSVDLSKPNVEEYRKIIKSDLSAMKDTIATALVFHNAGHIGTLDYTTELTDLTVWRKYYDLNLFSVVMLNSAFVKEVGDVAEKLVVVNITSLCGRKPFLNMGMYGSGKAARDILFQVLAAETPALTVLNYSPGPVDTNMVQHIVGNVKNEEVKGMFTNLLETKTILKPEQTVGKMLDILKEGNFKSGDILDYYDRI